MTAVVTSPVRVLALSGPGGHSHHAAGITTLLQGWQHQLPGAQAAGACEEEGGAPEQGGEAGGVQQVEAQEVEDGRLQQLHQAVDLHQHLHPHWQLRVAGRQLVCMPVRLRSRAAAQRAVRSAPNRAMSRQP